MTTTITQEGTASAPALAALDAARIAENDAQEALAAAERDLQAAQNQADKVAPADGRDGARAAAMQLASAQAEVDVLRRVLADATSSVADAIVDVIEAEADDLESGPLAKAREDLAKHDSAVAKAKAHLEAVSGAEYREVTSQMLWDELQATNPGAKLTFVLPARHRMQAEVDRLTTQCAMLRTAAEDPNLVVRQFASSWDDLPESLGPDGLLPCPLYPKG